jgi:hypothetical protein
MSPADARHATLRKFGRPVINVKEDTGAVWGWIWFAAPARHPGGRNSSAACQ